MPTVTAPADTMPADTSFADTDLTGRRQHQQSVRHARVRRRLRALLLAALAGSVVIPLVVFALLPSRTNPELMRDASLATSLVGISMLVGAFLLPSRLRTVSEALGIERLLRSHRALAVIGTALALGHAAAAVAHAPHGLLILDLRTAPPRVWAACAATLSLIAIVVLGLTRRRRRPRYEGWRLVHILLANIAVVGTTLHVIWLNDLTRTPVARAWFLVLLLVVALVNGHRWIHRPWRAKRTPYTVEEVRRETASAVTLVLRAEGHPGTPFRPGQFAFLKIGQSAHIFEEHPFSIASAATKPWRKELTIKAIGDFSEVVGGLRPGRRVHLDAAHGGFTPDGLHSDGLVLIAGGVGVTPMLSIVRARSPTATTSGPSSSSSPGASPTTCSTSPTGALERGCDCASSRSSRSRRRSGAARSGGSTRRSSTPCCPRPAPASVSTTSSADRARWSAPSPGCWTSAACRDDGCTPSCSTWSEHSSPSPRRPQGSRTRQVGCGQRVTVGRPSPGSTRTTTSARSADTRSAPSGPQAMCRGQ